MGISIDLHVYDYDVLAKALIEKGATEPLLGKILEKCGYHLGGKYLLLNNEYYDGYSPYYNVAELVDCAFGIEDSFDVFLNITQDRNGINSVDKEEVAEELGIKLVDSDDE